MYIRKTRDIFILEQNYGYGWEYVLEEDNRKDILQRKREYIDNTNYPTRILKKREKING